MIFIVPAEICDVPDPQDIRPAFSITSVVGAPGGRAFDAR
jgi:hypothetical protein